MPPLGTLNFTAADRPFDVAGIRRRVIIQYAGPASYVTGGDPLVAADIKLGVIEDIPEQIVSNGTNILCIVYNNTAGTMQFFDTSSKAEVAAATNLSLYVGRFEAVGR